MQGSYDIRSIRALIERDPLVSAAAELVAAGTNPVYLVGGTARDLLLGRTPLEVDLAVEGDAVAFAREVAQTSGGDLIVHDRFGTAAVRIGQLRLDFASTRTETYPAPGALPVVSPSALADDLERRDFSVNAISICLAAESFGQLECWPGALDDLESEIVRVLHDRSFIDDPTRLLRMCRYAARLGFEIADSTRSLAEQAVAEGALETVSATRIGNELTRCFQSGESNLTIDLLSEFGIFDLFGTSGEFGRLLKLAQAQAPFVEPEELRVACVFLGASNTDAVTALQLPARLAKLAAEASQAGRLREVLAAQNSRSGIANLLRGLNPAVVAAAAASSDHGQANAKLWFGELAAVECPISAQDLKTAGISEGPSLGIGLRAAWDWYLDASAPTREGALKVAIEAAHASGAGQS